MAGENDYRLALIADLSQMERGLARITNDLAGVVGGLRETDAAIKGTEATSKRAADSQGKFTTSLNSTRYALYDVSRTLTVTGIALLGMAALPTKVAIDFEREFANVKRTVSGASEATRTALIGLSNTIPVTFKNLTEIATLGGQLGISANGIISFTSTVAKLTATTNLSAEVAGTALGRFKSFGLVTTDQFGNLASAILKVGVNSVATESQIVGIATGIAGIGKVAGLSAATLVGYAGALASVGIQQYAARGSTQRFITEIQKAASDGGPALETFAKISGYSAEQIRTSFGTDKFNPIFQSLIENLGDTSRTGKDLNSTLAELGINSVIDRRTLLQLSAAPQAVKQAFADANSGIKSSGELNKQYGNIAQTTASKIQVLQNQLQSLLATTGQATAGGLNFLVGGISDVAKTLTELAGTGAGQVFLTIATGASVLVGVLALVGGVSARGAAGIIGMVTALRGLNAETGGSVGLLAALRTELEATGRAGKIASVGIGLTSIAVKGLVVAAGVIAVSQLLGWFMRMGDNASQASIDIDKLGDTTVRVGQKISAQTKELDRFTRAASSYQSSFNISAGSIADRTINQVNNRMAQQVTGINGAFTQSGSPLKAIDDLLGGFPGHFSGLDQAREAVDKIDGALAKLVKGGNIQGAQQAMTHLLATIGGQGLNYVNFKEFMDQFPQYKKALQEAAKAADAATNANAKLNSSAPVDLAKTLKDLSGLDDKGFTKYVESYQKSVSSLTDFNSIVKQVQTSLSGAAQAQAEAAGANAKATDYYDGSSVSLQQFTDQLNANNQAQSVWAQNLVILSTQAGPEAAQQFINAGYSAVNASILQQLVDATPEQRDAYIAAQQQAAQLASDQTAQALLASGFIVTAAGQTIGKDTAAKLAQGIQLGLPVEALMKSLNLRFNANPVVPAVDTGPAQGAINGLIARNYGRTIVVQVQGTYVGTAGAPGIGNRIYASGGYVSGPGTGTSDSIPARLSNGEYVIKASRVRALGVGYLDSLNGGSRSKRPNHFADGGPVSGGNGITSGIVELGPNTMNIMRGMIQREIVVAFGSEAVARSANAGNRSINRRGGA